VTRSDSCPSSGDRARSSVVTNARLEIQLALELCVVSVLEADVLLLNELDEISTISPI
jgi:hypothetical protein